MDEVFKNLPLAEQKKMLDYLAKLPDVRCLSSEEREKYDESIKAVDDYYSGLYGAYIEGEKEGFAKGFAEVRAEGELSKGVYTNLKVYHFLIKKCTTPNRLQRYA